MLHRRSTPVPWRAVNLDASPDGFFAPRLAANRALTIPSQLENLRRVGCIDLLRRDVPADPSLAARHAWGGTTVMFWDHDVAKWLESASYSLATHPDAALEAETDAVCALFAALQEPDGYVNSFFTRLEPDNRWANLRDWHELYCAGHLIEAAVARYEALGKRDLLDVMRRYAAYIASVFGTAPGQRRGYCGHPEIELALIRLARATGETRWLDLAAYFVDERGSQPHYYDAEAIARGEDPAAFWAGGYAYNQAHLPVRKQERAVGHAVRAMYLYSAMADLAGARGDDSLLAACERLWDHMAEAQLYVTGGIGQQARIEGFGDDYDLPNETAYAETCAAIGLIFWAQRMLGLTGDGRYGDTLERALYNGALSGISLDGQRYFYGNPLASDGSHHRSGWFGCACCPPNISRLLASLGGYIYATGEASLSVQLYIASQTEVTIGGAAVGVRLEAGLPWDGAVRLMLSPEQPTSFALRLRIPDWAAGATASVNGAAIELTLDSGYLTIERTWAAGDVVTLDLPLVPQRIDAHPLVAAQRGRVALRYGPLVYCLEGCDHAAPLETLRLPADAALHAEHRPELLGSVTVILADGVDQAGAPQPLTFVPYYAWDNRAPGEMAVWVLAGQAAW